MPLTYEEKIQISREIRRLMTPFTDREKLITLWLMTVGLIMDDETGECFDIFEQQCRFFIANTDRKPPK